MASRLPGKRILTAIDLLEKRREVTNVFGIWEKGAGTLKNDDLCPKNFGYLFRALPCQPHLLGRAKAAVEVSFGRAHGGFQAAVGRAVRRVCYQLPRLHAVPEFGRRFGSPPLRYHVGRRLVKGCLNFNGREMPDIAGVSFRPAATADKKRSLPHSDKGTTWPFLPIISAKCGRGPLQAPTVQLRSSVRDYSPLTLVPYRE